MWTCGSRTPNMKTRMRAFSGCSHGKSGTGSQLLVLVQHLALRPSLQTTRLQFKAYFSQTPNWTISLVQEISLNLNWTLGSGWKGFSLGLGRCWTLNWTWTLWEWVAWLHNQTKCTWFLSLAPQKPCFGGIMSTCSWFRTSYIQISTTIVNE